MITGAVFLYAKKLLLQQANSTLDEVGEVFAFEQAILQECEVN